VIHRIERHVGHDLAAAGSNWYATLATVDLNEHPQKLKCAFAFDVAVQLCKQRIMIDAVEKLFDVHAQVILPAGVPQILLELIATAMGATSK
jgi:hypothetical protein